LKVSFLYTLHKICLFIAFACEIFSVIEFLNWEKDINNIIISVAALALGFIFASFSFWFYNDYIIAENKEDEKEWKKNHQKRKH